MGHLLLCPDEILLKIIEQTCPDGIEALVLTSRKVYNICDEIFQEHRLNKKKYNELRWPPVLPNPFPGRSGLPMNFPACSLADIILQPHLRLYVNRIGFFPYHRVSPTLFLQPFANSGLRTTDDVWQDFFNVSDCPYIPRDEMDEWQQELDRSDSEAVFAFILTVLPNLKWLIMELDGVDERGVRRVLTIFSNILQAHQSSKLEVDSTIALSKLETVARFRLPGNVQDMGLFETICMLPSMSGILVAGGHHAFDCWPQIPELSNVTRLCLSRHYFVPGSSNGEVQRKGITRTLDHLKKLEVFSIDVKSSYNLFSVPKLIEILVDKAKHTLISLFVCVDGLENPQHRNESFRISGLKAFTSLTHITLSLGLLLVTENADETQRMTRLVDTLPASMEHLYISHDHKSYENKPALLFGLFDGMLEWKSTRLPNFTSITFEYFWVKVAIPLAKESVAICEEVGVELLVKNQYPLEYDSEEASSLAFFGPGP